MKCPDPKCDIFMNASDKTMPKEVIRANLQTLCYVQHGMEEQDMAAQHYNNTAKQSKALHIERLLLVGMWQGMERNCRVLRTNWLLMLFMLPWILKYCKFYESK